MATIEKKDPIVKVGDKVRCVKDVYMTNKTSRTINHKKGDLVEVNDWYLEYFDFLIENPKYFVKYNDVKIGDILESVIKATIMSEKDGSRSFSVFIGERVVVDRFNYYHIGRLFNDPRYFKKIEHAKDKEIWLLDDPMFGRIEINPLGIGLDGKIYFQNAMGGKVIPDPTVCEIPLVKPNDMFYDTLRRRAGNYRSELEKNMSNAIGKVAESFKPDWGVSDKKVETSKPIPRYKVKVGGSDGRVISIKTPDGGTITRFDPKSVLFSKQGNRLVNGKTKMTLDIFIDDDDIEFTDR